MQERAITRLIELDAKVEEIRAVWEKRLAELERNYKEEEQRIAADLSRKAEDESNAVIRQIMQEAQEEVNNLNEKAAQALENMEQEFQNVHQSLTSKIIEQVFNIERERHG
ncbi:conserved protein of unknown function [Tepidanaerobacter acetatoxydans Re1]|uniref:Uncharacterized protein n=1 Tax=Tepidanaerobacter acetatoxydans (strain DSM 21804 / JCM 16047 / Re1) TaxID=1209989 RepID=F4LVC9_TEPAE|nr:hypothetical protein [Tepidanaerobacter acetatoxydans]AEE90704.1 hypothetical protein TepRe1_0507 [Tepidanaerobacter acetatoxydans Re1]CCP25245.1 conserved protein of unknown function [Tepidanaerobacter acetatoxydans Re1]